MKTQLRFAVFSWLPLFASLSIAAIPPTINYQGYLTNSSSVPVNATVSLTFRLYAAATGGAASWTETQPAVTVANGNFNVTLGTVTSFDALEFDVPYWLSVAVNSDAEMAPRQPLSSVPYAVVAAALDGTADVSGSQINGPITAATIAGSQITGTITSASLPGSQITGAIATATIGGSQITGDINAAGNLLLTNSTASTGNILKGPIVFLHNFGSSNTFVGEASGNFTQTGSQNSAFGTNAMQGITDGFNNTAAGWRALRATTSGYQNSAFGGSSLLSNQSGNDNTALGNGAMQNNIGGNGNTAIGSASMAGNTGGTNNTAIGFHALNNATGSGNIALGADAGTFVTSGSGNIHIGHTGNASDNNILRIGSSQTATYIAAIRGVVPGADPLPVLIDNTGRLAVGTSSRTVKDAIADMGETSEILMNLRPVTFHYRDRAAAGDLRRQYGLIAEEVAKVAPDLVAHSADGGIESVFYQHLPPMLLNEYQKQQRTIRAQAGELARQRARMETLERELQTIKSMLGTR